MPIDKAVVLFGRQADCDVVLLNSRKVSRKHCCIAQINGEFVIRDLGSMNGVRVNGQQVQKESRLGIGDEVYIGDVGYRLAAVDNLPRKTSPVPTAAKKPLVSADPRFLSQDIPVALPDELVDFSVEETAPKLKPVAPQAKPKPKPKPRPKKPGGVIELTEDDIIDD